MKDESEREPSERKLRAVVHPLRTGALQSRRPPMGTWRHPRVAPLGLLMAA